MQQPQGSLLSNLRSLLESGLGADVFVVAADGHLAAHSSILVARSPVFGVLLRRMKRMISIRDMPMDVVRQLLTFMYTDEVPQLQSVAPQLLALADRFELPALKKKCEQHLIENLRVENTPLYCVLARRHSCPLLYSAAIDYFARHAHQVVCSQGWIEELTKDPKLVAEIPHQVANHAVSIASSMEEIRTWMGYESEVDKENISA
ncbi:speckle-type POZ protein-like [Schistocerca nitens]|uniref:speckle-type POZ protein-like n=1 Tax=Schistocerca nitens TaxID=7011 RepID=UPI0021175D01|nr:speckle-type POZ protein-like [Schistocerca nitens]XP_049799015.1 speckle-type POZ protein-like [Schistocerca nitens]